MIASSRFPLQRLRRRSEEGLANVVGIDFLASPDGLKYEILRSGPFDDRVMSNSTASPNIYGHRLESVNAVQHMLVNPSQIEN